MFRFLAAIGAACLLMHPLLVQSAPQPAQGRPQQVGPSASDCEEVRQAVARYGYAAAKRYAEIHYGKEAASYGDQCLTKRQKES
jgi:hypothetical protein